MRKPAMLTQWGRRSGEWRRRNADSARRDPRGGYANRMVVERSMGAKNASGRGASVMPVGLRTRTPSEDACWILRFGPSKCPYHAEHKRRWPFTLLRMKWRMIFVK